MNLNVIGTAANFKLGVAETTLSRHAGAVLLKDLLPRLSIAETLNQESDVKERSRSASFPFARDPLEFLLLQNL